MLCSASPACALASVGSGGRCFTGLKVWRRKKRIVDVAAIGPVTPCLQNKFKWLLNLAVFG